MAERAMLELEGIAAFYGEAQILRDVGFTVRRGEVFALLGRNGAGKTTTLKTAIGLLHPRAGRVRFDGNDITRLAPYRIARLGLGYVPEDRRIFQDLTVAQNLEVGRSSGRSSSNPWTIERLVALFPNLGERLGQQAGRLSGGEQQMLTLARTLMGNPDMLLLDEPSEGIAPVIVEAMAEAILGLKREGLAILLSEQNLPFARAIAERAAILDRGRIVAMDRFAAIDSDPDLLARHLAV